MLVFLADPAGTTFGSPDTSTGWKRGGFVFHRPVKPPALPAKPPAVPANCRECKIREHTVCQPLQGDRLQIVQTFKTGDRILPAGSSLYRAGEVCPELFNLLDGWVVLYRILKSGSCQILDFAFPGKFLGYQPELTRPMLHGANCLTDVSVCVFPRQPFPSLLEKEPSLAARLAWLNSRDTAIAHNHLTNIGARSARSRIAHLLLELSARLRRGGHISNGNDVEIPLTQSHIADALGLTSVYVSQILKQLREQQLLKFKNGRLQIFDPDGLAKIVDFEDHYIV